MKIIFAGTPEFAAQSLEALLNASHQVIAVYTQPDKPAGRGQQLQVSPIKILAEKHHIPVFQPNTLRDESTQITMRQLQPELLVVVAYGLLLPEAILSIPSLGCINMHPSLLPKWRGAAPIQRSIEAGDTVTGITIMQMDKGMDTGPILQQKEYVLNGDENSQMLHDQFSQQGALLLLETINKLEHHEITPISQNHAQATYAPKIEKQEAIINWTLPAVVIANKIRALNPWPIAHTLLVKNVLRVFSAKAITKETNSPPGQLIAITSNGLQVATGLGVLEITAVQLPGKRVISASEFVRGYQKVLIPNQTIFGA